jgi:hypothetical protein
VTLLVERQHIREWYSIEEFVRIGGRAEFTWNGVATRAVEATPRPSLWRPGPNCGENEAQSMPSAGGYSN